MQQINMFEIMKPHFKFTKPIRLIELFGGIGSQAKALTNLKCDYTHHKLVEFDKHCINSYNEIHNTKCNTSDITMVSGQDLEIVETKKYDYVMTYSFPCQDLSLAGKQAGMKKGSGTRSGLLWEVERILHELKELPQVLLMENVPDVIGNANIKDFNDWQKSLETLGYNNYVQLLNAKHYGIPQNRNRAFMVSILGDYSYTFPKRQKLTLRLKDFLEDEVDEKYYLSENYIKTFTKELNGKYPRKKRFMQSIHKDNNVIAWTIGTRTGERPTDNFMLEPVIKTDNKESKVYKIKNEDMPRHRLYDVNNVCFTITTADNQQPYIIQKSKGVKTDRGVLSIKGIDYWVRKLTPKECWSLMGFTDEDFNKASKVNSNAQLYKQAGNSIVVQVLEAIFKQML